MFNELYCGENLNVTIGSGQSRSTSAMPQYEPVKMNCPLLDESKIVSGTSQSNLHLY